MTTTVSNQASSKLVSGLYDNGAGVLTPVMLKCAADGTLLTAASAGSTSNTQEATQLLVKNAVVALNAKATAIDTGNVTVIASALPTGAATEASVSAINGKIPALVSGRTPVDGSGVYQPITMTVINPSSTFTRPANTTAYAVGSLVANDTIAGNVVPLSFTAVRSTGGAFSIRRIRLSKSGTSTTNAAFRVVFYNAAPTSAAGDGATFSTSGAASYLGGFDVFSMTAMTDGAAGNGLPAVGSEINATVPAGTTIYAMIIALSAYTPASGETFTVVPEITQY